MFLPPELVPQLHSYGNHPQFRFLSPFPPFYSSPCIWISSPLTQVPRPQVGRSLGHLACCKFFLLFQLTVRGNTKRWHYYYSGTLFFKQGVLWRCTFLWLCSTVNPHMTPISASTPQPEPFRVHDSHLGCRWLFPKHFSQWPYSSQK